MMLQQILYFLEVEEFTFQTSQEQKQCNQTIYIIVRWGMLLDHIVSI